MQPAHIDGEIHRCRRTAGEKTEQLLTDAIGMDERDDVVTLPRCDD